MIGLLDAKYIVASFANRTCASVRHESVRHDGIADEEGGAYQRYPEGGAWCLLYSPEVA